MKSLSKNYLYNLSYQILTLVTPLITTPYISRVLGVDGIGEYSFSYSIVAYFVLLILSAAGANVPAALCFWRQPLLPPAVSGF